MPLVCWAVDNRDVYRIVTQGPVGFEMLEPQFSRSADGENGLGIVAEFFATNLEALIGLRRLGRRCWPNWRRRRRRRKKRRWHRLRVTVGNWWKEQMIFCVSSQSLIRFVCQFVLSVLSVSCTNFCNYHETHERLEFHDTWVMMPRGESRHNLSKLK